MSLFQCEHCGCRENTALSCQGFKIMIEHFDWTGIEERKGLKLCSACGPTKYKDGEDTEYGKWHGEFDQVFLPMGMFRTNIVGNLEHIVNSSVDIMKYAIDNPKDT